MLLRLQDRAHISASTPDGRQLESLAVVGAAVSIPLF